MTDQQLLARAAARATQRDFYLAAAFDRWMQARQITWPDLVEFLGIRDDEYPALALCRKPDTRAESDLIADRFGCDPDRLAALVGIR